MRLSHSGGLATFDRVEFGAGPTLRLGRLIKGFAMGEKGNSVEDLSAAVAVASDPSVIEKVTTTTTREVVGVGEDLVSKIKDKTIESTADNVIAEGRERLHRSDKPDAGDAADGSTTPPDQA